ncbi:MAG: MBL fold metallo-hydrolase [Gammaproteobacteria bacterium]
MLTWRIGSVTVTSVVESETPTAPRFFFEGMSKAALLERAANAPWLLPRFISNDGYLQQKIQCLVIDTGTRRIAVDTCIGNDKERNNPLWHRLQGPFLDRMAQAGYPPEAITDVICTHLHVDHVGWNTRLVDGRWVATFANARYLFVRQEFEHWRATPSHDGDVFGDSVAPIHAAGLADMVAPDHVICPQVRLEPTHGHTPGHVSVAIASEGRRAIITGDMAHNPVQIADPELSTLFDTDQAAARATRHAAFARWADGETLVIGTHFATPTAGYLRRTAQGGFRFDVDSA